MQSIQEGTLAARPCLKIEDYNVCVEISITPDDIRSLSNPKIKIDQEQAKEFLHKMWKANMQPIKDALIESWSNSQAAT